MKKEIAEAPQIQIWKTFAGNNLNNAPIITTQSESDGFRVRMHKPLAYPEDLKKRVDTAFSAANRKLEQAGKNQMTAGNVLYLIGEEGSDILAAPGTFDVTFYFNRTQEGFSEIEDLNKYSGLTLSTHTMVKTKDDKIIIGVKDNQFQQRSNWGGFPRVGKDFPADATYANLRATVAHRTMPELGYNAEESPLLEVRALGITYVDRMSLRGTDMNFIADVDRTSEQVQKDFTPSKQFSEVFPVKFSVDGICQFIESVHQFGEHVSPYAMGCLTSAVNANWGPDAAKRVITTISETYHKGVQNTIGIGNSTKYLNN